MTVNRAAGALEAKQVVRALVDPWAELRRIRALIRSLVLKAMTRLCQPPTSNRHGSACDYRELVTPAHGSPCY